MSVLGRLTVFVSSLVFFGFTVFLASLALGWDAAPTVDELIRRTLAGDKLGVSVLALVSLLIGLGLFLLATQGRRPERAIVRETGLGEVRIHLKAVESLVYRAARQVKGIKEIEASALTSPDGGLEIYVSALVTADLSIPSVSDEVQAKIEQYVRDTVGIPVSRVHMSVRNVAPEARTRLE